ncbi:PREDICTED: protein sickie-like [Eufriesea mexicana]|uniref:protein sickie-like n=1 Tax=Eufriesea mexicana TaxID=516756 RepID=UPI00083BE43F|nr:PREDICTED: protein sickie-like [Eufriesea mexicana]
MACIRAPRSVCGSSDDIKADSTRNVIQIYTDWANYYLERGGCKRRVTDLQLDLCDGVLLADLVEAVTNQKVIDVNRRPKNAQQMVSFHSRVPIYMLFLIEKFPFIYFSLKNSHLSAISR